MTKYKRIAIDGKYYSQFTYKKTPQIVRWSSKKKTNKSKIRKFKTSLRLRIKSQTSEKFLRGEDKFIPASYISEKYRSKKTGNTYHVIYRYETKEEDPMYQKIPDDERGLSRQEQLEIIAQEYGDDLNDFESVPLMASDREFYGARLKMRLKNEKKFSS